MIASPTSCTCATKSSTESSTRKPGIDSSLSSVPPVWPSPRPLIFPTGTPHAATIGPTAIEVLSPTPPVECLSTTLRPSAPRRGRASRRCGSSRRSARTSRPRSGRGRRRPCRTPRAGSPGPRRARSRGSARRSRRPGALRRSASARSARRAGSQAFSRDEHERARRLTQRQLDARRAPTRPARGLRASSTYSTTAARSGNVIVPPASRRSTWAKCRSRDGLAVLAGERAASKPPLRRSARAAPAGGAPQFVTATSLPPGSQDARQLGEGPRSTSGT